MKMRTAEVYVGEFLAGFLTENDNKKYYLKAFTPISPRSLFLPIVQCFEFEV